MGKQNCPKRAEGGQIYTIQCSETFAEEIQNLPRRDPVQPVLNALERGIGLDDLQKLKVHFSPNHSVICVQDKDKDQKIAHS